MQKLRLTLLFVFVALFAYGQKSSFKGELQPTPTHSILQEKFKAFKTYKIDAAALHDYLQLESPTSNNIRFTLDLGEEHDWDLLLAPHDLRAANYVVNTPGANGVKAMKRSSNKSFNGYVQGAGGGTTALTVDENFIYGFIQKNKEVYFIEPLRYLVGDAAQDEFIVYAQSDVINDGSLKCGADELKENIAKAKLRKTQVVEENDNDLEKVLLTCYDVDIALAADFSMFTKYGSVTGVENHNIGVLNNVQTNYDDEFTHELNFVIVTQFVSDCNTCDPWTGSTDPGALLDDFRSWGNSGGFGAGIVYDVASHWTNRNFDGSTVGLAWVGVICGSFRYNVLQDFTGTAWALRVLQAHELGHNFDAFHDASGSSTIMAPSINNSNAWSPASIADINAHAQNRINSGCLTLCASGAPPVADFTSNIQTGCAPLTVNFTDLSTDATSWSWTFEGGTPATSTQQNPTVTYNTQGEFDVTLEVSNSAGNNTITQVDYILVDDIPDAGFTANFNELIVDFTNTSTNATSYFWDFGDANTSTVTNPTHVYSDDGIYVVTLEAVNDCGTHVFTDVITVISTPFAFFTYDQATGCLPLTVQFANQSSANVTDWSWTFPGGNPASSSDPNPLVVYNNPGVFSVELTVSNAAGSDTYTELGLIEVLPIPTASFTYVINNDTEVVFTNTSTDADSYTWDFGDGNSSSLENPTHTYAAAGSYQVFLISSNPCDSPSASVTINIVLSVPPVANFQGDVLFGCVPHIVEFEDLSTNATSWAWSFPGGAPATSTNQDPKITYNEAGVYDVTLIATNATGSDTITFVNYITIDDVPDADFIPTANGAIVDFSNITTNGDSYVWDFGDTNTSTATNPTHTYAANGTYTVQLIATNICGNDTTDQEIIVVTAPTADFTADVTSGCAALTVNFTDQSIGATAWSWVFTGGTPATSTAQNPTVVYDTEGTYAVELTVTNAAGNNTLTQTNYITVNDVPTPAFNTTQTGNDVNFNNNTTNGDTYLWDFGDASTSTLENPSHTYPGDGTYTVTLTATNACGSETITQTIVISTLPTAAFTADVTSGCAALTVNFTDQSSLNVTSWAWTFEGGTPATSTAENPTVVYTTAGTYDVTLTVTNAAGNNTVTQTNYITVNDVPTAGFTSTVNGMVVNFNNTSTNATSYAWDFGDTNTSTATNPAHTYAADGTYTVTLVATNACGSNTITQTLVISTVPTANFSAGPTSGCAPLTVVYTDESSANAVSWVWAFPGGTPASSTAENPTVVYNTAGTYDVTLTVTNAAGETNTLTETNYITVNDVPSASFTSTVNGMMVNFNNTSTNATSYAWDFGDTNTSTATNPAHTYAADGTYTVTLVATNACGSNTTTQTVVITTSPTANFSAGPTSGCAPLTVVYTDESSANAVSWAWTFPGGTPASSTAENPTVVYNTAGIYDVTLTVTNAAGETNTLTETNYITVNDVPSASFTSTVNGMMVNFNNTSTNATSYAWDFGDTNTSTATNPAHTYVADGTYTVTLVATNACGSNTTTQTVVISNAPTANFSAGPTSGCAPLTVVYTDESSANAVSWAWTFPGGTPASSTAENPTVVYNVAGIYDVTLTVTNAAGETNTITETNYISVEDLPTAAFTSNAIGSNVIFNNTSTNATSYLWDFGDGNTSTATNPSHIYAVEDVYTVTLTATNDCGSVSATDIVTVVTSPFAGFTANVTTGCVPLTVTFTDQSSANTTEWDWTFGGGTPATSGAQNPTVVFSTPGVYTVSLVASNIAGSNTFTQTGYITVLAGPTADFTSTVTGTLVDFNNNSNNANTYLWNFGDGNTSTSENPSNNYAADGVYTVTLTAIGNCGTEVTTQIVTIATSPVADFQANITQGCAPLSVDFTDLSTVNATAWNWTFAGGTPATSTAQNPTVVYNTPGTYSVVLEASNAAGANTVTKTNYIVVDALPTASFTNTMAGTTANFNNTSTNALSYSWNFGDGGTSSDTNPSHTYGADGTYTVTLVATNDCGSITTTGTVVIMTNPVAGFSADPTSGCGPLVVNFTDESSANATSWLWTFEGGTPATSTEQNPTVAYNTPGAFGVTLVATSPAGNNTFAQNGYINVLGSPNAVFTSNTIGTTTTFSNTTTGGSSYNWDFGDGNSSIDPNPAHTYATDGTYMVTLTATNDCGSTTATETIVIVTSPTAGFTANGTTGCAPLTVNFIDQSSSNTTGWFWTFEGGTPATSTEQNPIVTFSTPGVYTVTQEVSNAAGTNTTVQTSYIIVLDGPTAGFTSTQISTTQTFNNTSTNGDTYFWDFGDGNTSTMENPSHTYTMSGTYTVILTTTNDCGSVTATEDVTITISAAPVAAFAADVLSGCAPLTVNYTDQSSANTTSWLWTFEGGTPATSTAQNPQVLYGLPGNFNVTLTVMNAVGENTVTQNSFIQVSESAPLSEFTTSITNATAIFENGSTGGSSYSWDFGDGNMSAEESPTHTYMEDGTYEVVLTVTNNCGTAQTTETVVIATLPNAGFSMDTNEGCGPLSVNFMDASSNNTTTWAWEFPGGTPGTSTDQNPTVTYATPGTYDVTLVVTNAQGTDTEVQVSSITVAVAPTADFSASGSGLTIDFSNNATAADTYAWTFGDGGISTESDPSHTYTNGGDYDVQLIVTNSCGADTTTQVVTIGGAAPTASFTGTPVSGCSPMEVDFTDLSTGASSWVWTLTGGTPATSTEQSPQVVYNTPGTYPVTLSVTNPFGSNSITQVGYITVGEAPVAGFTSSINNSTVDVTNTSTGTGTYFWDFGDGQTSVEENPSHTYTANGNYTITLTVTNNCGSTIWTEDITIMVTSTTLPETVESFVFYPNPNNGSFHLEIEAVPTAVLQVELYDVIGRKMMQEHFDFHSGRLSHRFDMTYLAAGTYVLQLVVGEDVVVRKVVVEK